MLTVELPRLQEDEPARQERPGPILIWWYGVPPILAALTGWWAAGTRQLWLDEYATWWAATLHREDFFGLIAHLDTVQAPYYVFLHYWMLVFGVSPFSMRLPSIIAFVLAAIVVTALGRRLYGPPVGVLAGAIMACIPFLGLYAQTARPYAFAVLFASLSTYMLFVCIDRPSSVWRWSAYALALIGLGALHLVGMMILISHGLGLLYSWRKEKTSTAAVIGFSGSGVVAIAALLPIIVRGYSQQGQIGGGAKDMNEALFLMIYAFRAELSAAVLVWFALVGLCFVSIRHSRRLVLMVWGIFPYALVIPTIDVLNLAKLRYLLFALPPWCILAAAALHRLATAGPSSGVRWSAKAAAVLAFALMIPGTIELHRDPLLGYPDYRSAATALHDARSGDGAIYAGDGEHILHQQMMAYYLRPRGIELQGAFLAQAPREAGNFDGARCRDLSGCLSRYPRIWLITTAMGDDAYARIFAPQAELLRTRYNIESERRFDGVRVLLLVRR